MSYSIFASCSSESPVGLASSSWFLCFFSLLAAALAVGTDVRLPVAWVLAVTFGFGPMRCVELGGEFFI